MGLLDILGFGQNKKLVEDAIKRGGTVVDVRTPQEFAQGHLDGSKNYPLDNLSSHIEKLKKLEPLILVCSSGMRSGSANKMLKNKGLDCCNGGSWRGLEKNIN